MSLRDSVSIITGGTRGIGYGFAEALLAKGGRVVICGRDETSLKFALDKLSAGCAGSIAGVVADVRYYEDCRKLVAKTVHLFGKVDILINNAGVGHVYKPADEITPDVWDQTIGTNLSGMFFCSHEVIPHMRKVGSGYIFNISSVAEILRLPGGSAYNSSKCGVSGLTETLMKDLRYDGIRVSEIVLGSVSTPDRGYEDWKLAVEDVARIVIDLYEFPPRALVGRVELWPTKSPPNR